MTTPGKAIEKWADNGSSLTCAGVVSYGSVAKSWRLRAAPPDDARALCHLIAPNATPAVATAAFADVEFLVEDGFFAADTGGVEFAQAYEEIVELAACRTLGSPK